MMLRHFQKTDFNFFSFFVVLHRFAQTQKNCRGREGCLRDVMVQRAVACSSWKDGQANQGIKVSLKKSHLFKKRTQKWRRDEMEQKIKLSISSSATFSSHRTFLHFFVFNRAALGWVAKFRAWSLEHPGSNLWGCKVFYLSRMWHGEALTTQPMV